MLAVEPMTVGDIRAALRKAGWYSNTVKPPAAARCLSTHTGIVQAGPFTGARITVEYHQGAASDGHKSNFERRDRWWTVVKLGTQDGFVVWQMGARWSDRRKALADFADSARSIREGR